MGDIFTCLPMCNLSQRRHIDECRHLHMQMRRCGSSRTRTNSIAFNGPKKRDVAVHLATPRGWNGLPHQAESDPPPQRLQMSFKLVTPQRATTSTFTFKWAQFTLPNYPFLLNKSPLVSSPPIAIFRHLRKMQMKSSRACSLKKILVHPPKIFLKNTKKIPKI